MSQDFVKGYTNNHLTWAMVDATDGFTPESALSAATKIRVYGKLKGSTGVNFVSSGTGSMTNDIQHVGPSVFGLYTLALAKADLSDASAAWYDQYDFLISATGAAPVAIVVDGGIMASYLSNLVSYLSNMQSALSDVASNAYSAAAQGSSRALLAQSAISDLASYLVAMSGMLSDAHSAAILGASQASDALSAANVGNSRILLVQSRLSDFHSAMVSDISDIHSMLTHLSDAVSNAYSAAVVGASRTLLVQSRLSDLDSRLVSDVSDIRSAIAGITVTISASDLSDIASAVVAATGSTLSDIQSYLAAMSGMLSDTHSAAILAASHASDALSATNVGNSRILLVQSRLSDFDSRMVSDVSDIRSAIAAISVNLSTSNISDIASAVVAGLSGLVATASDVASKVWSEKYTAAGNVGASTFGSALRLNMSRISDVQSYLAAMSGMLSDAHSAAILGASHASDALSATNVGNSRLLLVQSRLSDLDSRLVSDVSDIRSMLTALSDMTSNAYSAAVVGASRALLAASHASDALSATLIGNSRILLVQSRLSDLDSRLVSDLSDIKSAIDGVNVSISASDISDIASAVAAGVGFSPTEIADKVWSDFASKAGVTPSQLYSVLNLAGSRVSDVQSYLAAMSGMLSDAHSAAAQGSSRALMAQSYASDALSAANVGSSRALVMQSRLSDLDSRLVSDVSDMKSMLTALSDAVSNAYSAAVQGSSRALMAASMASDAHSAALVTQSMVSDLDAALTSQFTVEISTLSDIHSATVLAGDAAAGVYSALTTVRAEPGQGTPAASLAMLDKLDYLYKAWRNRSTQTATEYALYAADGVTKDHEAPVTDDGATFVRGQISTGA